MFLPKEDQREVTMRKIGKTLLGTFACLLFLAPTLGFSEIIQNFDRLVVVDAQNKQVGLVVDTLGTVYYKGEPSQATYFQFKDYVFVAVGPDGVS